MFRFSSSGSDSSIPAEKDADNAPKTIAKVLQIAGADIADEGVPTLLTRDFQVGYKHRTYCFSEESK